MALAVVLREEIPVPEDVEVTIDKEVTVTGPKGELKRKFKTGNISLRQEDGLVVLETRFPKKKDKAMLGTIKSHISNMIHGLTEGFTYKMKIVYAHFPMTVKAAKDKVTIENFLGERYPRTAKVVGTAQVKVQGDEVVITGVNKEDVGQTMANLEQATKIKGETKGVPGRNIPVVRSDPHDETKFRRQKARRYKKLGKKWRKPGKNRKTRRYEGRKTCHANYWLLFHPKHQRITPLRIQGCFVCNAKDLATMDPKKTPEDQLYVGATEKRNIL